MTKPQGQDGPDDVDAIFGEIVADLRADGVGGTAPSPRDQPEAARREEDSEDPEPAASGWRDSPTGWDDTMLTDDDTEDDDEHYVPPEPPPLPTPSSNMIVVGLFFALGLVLLIAPSLVGLTGEIGFVLGMLSLSAGIGFLLLHAKDDPRPPGSDPETGAQI